jgi:4-aminobutyrate aminotransferase-like enzyme
MGLFAGVELVTGHTSLTPATAAASDAGERPPLRHPGQDGQLHNVLELRPPLVVTAADIDLLLGMLGAILAETPLQPAR